jgi:LmbE family N-acetylglucosaminyl deacetylase
VSNPYRALISGTLRAWRRGAALPLGGLPPAPRPAPAPDAPKALLFSPHPDDECLTGALPLRLLREGRWRVINAALTLGSRPGRRRARLGELRGACGFLGFELALVREGGLEGLGPRGREIDPANWASAVSAVSRLLREHEPRAVFLPHPGDWNPTHAGASLLVREALRSLGGGFSCRLVETEYWAAMPRPNLMVESSPSDAADLVAAASFHAGEMRRQPFHLELPAWMQDNARRGSELVLGHGAASEGFAFATLYRLSLWKGGRLRRPFEGGRAVARDADALAYFR